jgi:hypothetical protein
MPADRAARAGRGLVARRGIGSQQLGKELHDPRPPQRKVIGPGHQHDQGGVDDDAGYEYPD